MKAVLHLSFKKGGWEWGEIADKRFDESGEVMQDLNKQKIAYKWGIPEYRRFKIVIPDGNGEFIKFYGKHNPNRCRRTKVKTFPQLAGEIKHWRLKENTKMKNGMEKQTWYNEIFRINGPNGKVKKWTVISDPVKKQVVPVRYQSSYRGTQEEQCCHYDVHTNYKEVAIDANTNTDDWFQVPEFCP